MRKIVSMLLIAMMCCGLLTGCAKPKVQKLGPADNNEEVVEDVQEDNDADEENEMSPEEEAELLKEQEESLTIYADMISEIEQVRKLVSEQRVKIGKLSVKNIVVA